MTYNDFEISLPQPITLRGRHYAGGHRTPVLCVHGLTRNAKDFSDLAPKIAAMGHDVYAISLRGRGASDHDPDYLNYHPQTYRDDILNVLNAINAPEAIFIGTSLGGIVTMLTHEHAPARVKAVVLNDVGPELAPEGVTRIAGYVGASAGPAANLDEAAARIKAINGVAFPDATDEEWLVFAERTFRQQDNDGWTLDYDPNIARALAELGPAPDLWLAFEGLKDTPTLVIRGARSDLLTPPIIDKMRAVHPNFHYTEVPRIGHAPMMTEPDAWNAVAAFLKMLD